MSVAVNFSPRQFIKEKLDHLIFEKIKQRCLPCDALEVEITESLLLNQNKKIKDILDALSDKNISIAIDGFGTGYSA